MVEGREGTDGPLWAGLPCPEMRSGILALWPSEPFPALSWPLSCPVLLSVEYLKKAGEDDCPLIVIDSLGRG